MAVLLAPYNDAMRLGMGFNSFTQQLCINDAVGPAGERLAASHRPPRPQYRLGTMSDADISQDVTWTAKFVDRISEVTDSMNVSGSLQIKCDALGGGGEGSASFIDTNKFKESDINYLIQVKVTNQRHESLDLTEFCPIKDLPDSEFTRVYGDSFISGFTEGGEFYGLISIKLNDRSKTKEMKGKLKVNLNFSGASVGGNAEASKTDAISNIDGQTTISVSWRGGGDIKDATVGDWTLETLKAVAMEFPEHVMACPMYTNAILTKYTSLKSFYQKTIKGSPLDYENAGVYSSALLDAYMDYKVMWRNIQTAIWEVEQQQSELSPKNDIPKLELEQLSQEARENYENQSKRYAEELARYQQEYGTQKTKDDGFVYVPSSADGVANVVVQNVPPVSQALPLQLTAGDEPERSTHSENGAEALPTSSPLPTNPSGSVIVPAPAPTVSTPVSAPVIVPQPSAPSTSLAVFSKPSLPEPPMPPNDIKSYRATILGLEKARRDCRFEMIKIVREVDAVANDPKIACDPTRAFQYLSPTVFRMLLPTVTNLSKERAEQLAAEAAKKLSEDSSKLGLDLVATQRELEAARESARLAGEEANKLRKESAEKEKQFGIDLTATQKELEAAHERSRVLEAAKKESDPWNRCSPAAEGSFIRFMTSATDQALDYSWSNGNGSGRVIQHPTLPDNTNQKWCICRAGPVGYVIRHCETGRCLAVASQASNEIFYITMHELGSVFTFEPKGNSTYYIHLANQPDWTLNLLNWGRMEGRIGIWSGAKNECDSWYVKPWY